MPVTQRVPPERVDDLMSRPRRVAVAFAGPDGPDCVPALVRGAAPQGPFTVGVTAGVLPATPVPVTLVSDDGWSWFELRAIVWRGTLTPAAPGPDGVAWCSFAPASVIAWDYGQLAEEPS